MESQDITTLESVALPSFCDAYVSLLPILSKFPVGPQVQWSLNVPTVVTRVLCAWPILCAHREALVAHNPQLDRAEFTRLKQYALAFGYAHSLYVTTGNTTDEVARHRSILFGLLVATYDQLRTTLLALRNEDHDLKALLPRLVE